MLCSQVWAKPDVHPPEIVETDGGAKSFLEVSEEERIRKSLAEALV